MSRWHTGELPDAGNQLPVVDVDCELLETEARQHLIDETDILRVCQHALTPDGIGIALIELAVPALLWPLGAPNWVDLVSLKRFRQLWIHGDDAAERHGEIIAEGDVLLATAVSCLIDKFFGIRSVFAHQHFGEFQRGRLEGFKSKFLEDCLNGIDDVVPAEHLFG